MYCQMILSADSRLLQARAIAEPHKSNLVL